MADGWGPPAETQVVGGGWSPPAEITSRPTEAGWGPPKPQEPEKPMPGFFSALSQGLGAGISDVGTTLTLGSSTAPQVQQETSPAAQPFEWRDIYEPTRGLKKAAYQIAKSSPTIGAGILGGAAGEAVEPAGGGLVGAPLGAMAGNALQTIGPVFAQELKKTPGDPDGAWDRAVKLASISAAGTGASWAAFPLRIAGGPLKNIVFQAFGVQPAIGEAEKVASNVVQGQPLTEGLGQTYAQSVVGTAVPLLGERALARTAGMKGAGQIVQRTAAQDNILQSAQQKFLNADQLDQSAKAPGLTTDQVYNMRLQAEMTRQEAQHETFLANIPPQLPQRGLIKNAILKNFLPELTSEKALQTAPRFGEFASERGQNYDSILTRAQEIRNQWDWVPFDDVRRWFQVYETKGATLPPDLAQKYPFMQRDMPLMKKWLNQAYFDETDVGSKAEYVMEYFPHLWKQSDQARTLFSNLQTPGTAGATWFQKARYYDLIEHGLQNGLELRTKNPVDLVSMRLMSGADMRAKMNLLNDLRDAGVAIPVTEAPGNLLNSMRQPFPWQQIDAPNRSRWLLAPDVQHLWENAVVSKGLWADPGVVGQTFRGWMGLKAAWVPIKLGVSMFHPVHVAWINAANNITRAIGETFSPGQQGMLRRMTALPEAAVQSVLDLAMAFPIGLPHLGKEVRTAWKQMPSTWTPRQQYLMDLYQKAGVSPQLAEQMRSQGRRSLQEGLVNVFGPDRTAGQRALSGAYLPIPAIKRLAGLVSEPFFEHWIPNLKAAALTREAEALFRRRPDLMADPDKMRIALNAIGKQVDNRFGEMFYNSLFWNRTIKDAAIGSFLSLGWNLGFAREFMGGLLEPAARRMMGAPTPTRALIRDVTSKSTNLLVYGMGAMALNAMINKYFTGEDAKGLDYIFPRVGGTNTDGTARRLSTPHYTRELPMAEKNIEDQGGNVAFGLTQMLWHKMMFSPFLEMFQNKDYFGGQIFDPNAPAYKQAVQFFHHMITDQVSPMSVTGAQRALELSGKPKDWRSVVQAAAQGDRDVWLPFLGYGPAPSYASRSPLENRITSLARQYIWPNEKPFQENQNFKDRLEAMTAFKQATQRGDTQAAQMAVRKMSDLGMSAKQIKGVTPAPSAPKIFQRLPESLQVNLMRDMTKDEFQVYYPKASKKAKAEPDIIALAAEYYRRQP